MNFDDLYQKLIPDIFKIDATQYSFAKNLVGACLVSFWATPVFIVVYYFLNEPLISFVLVILEVSMLSSLIILHYSHSLRLSANILVGSLAIFLIWLTYYLGGIFSAAGYWLLLPPLIAAFIAGIRTGYVWAIISVAAITIFYFLNKNHFHYPITQINDLLLLQYVSICGLTLVIISLIYFYEAAKQVSMEKLRYLAYFDLLTDLPNQFSFENSLQTAIKNVTKSDESSINKNIFSLLHINMDNFKKINNTFGNAVGDLVLKEVVRRIKRHLSRSDILARTGRDEFKIISYANISAADLNEMANIILMAIRQPYHFENQEINITASIGGAIYPKDYLETFYIDRYVDIALSKAKKFGGDNYQYFTPALAESEALRIEIEHELPRVIVNDELFIKYQPQFSTKDPTKIVGFEALLRWNNKTLGSVSTAFFVEIAERIGFVSQLGEWIFREACQQYMIWYNAGLLKENITIGINISFQQLYRENFISSIEKAIKETGIPPHRIELELTETAIMTDRSYAIIILRKLNKLGVHIVIDDFGTGYTSLNYLIALPVSGIKIDKSFLDSIYSENNTSIIIESLVDLAHKINLKVIAEGVETVEQLNYLRKINCDSVQGFYLCTPLEKEDMGDLLSNNIKLNLH